ncbi:MAG: hypothetical protein HY928_03285 [Elusimicrobia bacterium]|nr:hypothetical protein [Elusimicrobiota bacterium]
MALRTLLLALLAALPAQAQLRSAAVRVPVLGPTLAAPQTPSLAAPLSASPALAVPSLAPLPSASASLALPKAAAAAATPTAVAAPAPAAPAGRMSPAFADEARAVAGLVAGRSLEEAELADIVGRTTLERVGWLKRLFNEFGVMASYPDGVAREDGRIELTERPARKLPDPEAHYRALFAHEYTHRLQFEGDVTKRWGIEVPPVAVELLRGLELVGLEGLKAGRIPFITANTLAGFESGRAWAAGRRADDTAFYFKGALAGAAWALASRTGRPADAWEFVRRVSSERRREAPGPVFAEFLGR